MSIECVSGIAVAIFIWGYSFCIFIHRTSRTDLDGMEQTEILRPSPCGTALFCELCPRMCDFIIDLIHHRVGNLVTLRQEMM